MIVAADAGLLDEAVGEVRAPVRAMAVEQPELSAQILVEHEVLAHQTNGLDRSCCRARSRRRSASNSGAAALPSAFPGPPG